MNEPAKSKPKIRRAFYIWLIFFIAIAVFLTWADASAARFTANRPPYWKQFLFLFGGTTLLCELFLFIRWSFSSWRNVRRVSIALAILATLIAIFYTEEDWRGKRDWEKCKRDLEAKGAVLDWDKYIPPAVPDDQNFFTVNTNFYLRFVKLRTEEQGNAANQLQWLRLAFEPNSGNIIAEVTVVTNANAVPEHADLYLRCDHSVVTVGTSHEDFTEPPSPYLAHFELKDVPLKKAIEQMAKAAKVNCTISSAISSVDSKGKPILVSIGWKNVTARAALYALLDNYHLVLVEDSNAGTAKVLSTKRGIYVDPVVVKKIGDELNSIVEQSTNGIQSLVLQGSTGLSLCAKPLKPVTPAHIVVLANKIPDVENIFSGNIMKSVGADSFRIYGSSSTVSAEDYLEWSDQYVPAFDEVREALKRPYAIIPGDYSMPYMIPIPNFITMRAMAQTLAQRAQCDFLLGKPEDALREVTLIHDMCRILEKPPTGQPETLVEAMINVAIHGLYVSTVADGFRLNAWHESQIAALQEQFKETKLLTHVFDAFQAEQAASTCTLEKTPASKIAGLFRMVDIASNNKPSVWKKFTGNLGDPMYWFFKLSPRGWIYQNMRTTAQEVRFRDGVNLKQETLSPQVYNKSIHDLDKSIQHLTPFNVWARIAIPNYLKAWQTTAHNQTLVNEGQIVCALERYRLAHGKYPETLDALAPQFIEKIPHDIIGGQPLHYQRTTDGKFLLYSIGWNETDDGGVESGKDFSKGDWVWKN